MNYKLPKLKWQDSKRICEWLKEGKSCLIATETVFGLMGNLDTELKLNQIKKSPENKPLSYFVGNWQQAQELWGKTIVGAEAMAKAFWPGPLTLIAGKPNSKGIRMPQISPLLELLIEIDPTLCTSANLSGDPAPQTLDDLNPELVEQVDFIIDEPAPESSGYASTILIYNHDDESWKSIREGSITSEQWKQVLTSS